MPGSPDERLTRELLVDAPRQPDLVVAVLDASNLTRNLYLTAQIADTGVPVVVALTMVDIARSRGLDVDHEALARTLGVPVVPVVPRNGEGVDALTEAVSAALDDRAAPSPAGLGDELEAALDTVSAAIVSVGGPAPPCGGGRSRCSRAARDPTTSARSPRGRPPAWPVRTTPRTGRRRTPPTRSSCWSPRPGTAGRTRCWPRR